MMEKAIISVILIGWIVAFGGLIALYLSFKKYPKHS